jgi:hypothetical protein
VQNARERVRIRAVGERAIHARTRSQPCRGRTRKIRQNAFATLPWERRRPAGIRQAACSRVLATLPPNGSSKLGPTIRRKLRKAEMPKHRNADVAGLAEPGIRSARRAALQPARFDWPRTPFSTCPRSAGFMRSSHRSRSVTRVRARGRLLRMTSSWRVTPSSRFAAEQGDVLGWFGNCCRSGGYGRGDREARTS